MTKGEREMVRPLDGSESSGDLGETTPAVSRSDRSTSLQPTYEDTVRPNPQDDWFEED